MPRNLRVTIVDAFTCSPGHGNRAGVVTDAEALQRADMLATARAVAVRARAEQGDAMGKPGRVDLEVTGSPGRIERTRVGGVAVTVMDGSLWPDRAPAAGGAG